MTVRLRQAVLVASELEPVLASLRTTLGLGEPFRDPGVAEFALHNAVCAIGDCFLEVVAPLSADTAAQTAAGRHLARLGGDGGYMLIFQLDDLDDARRRACELGVRTVWQIDLPDMSGTHLHPGDMGGAIVSLDSAAPAGAWRWAGPQWTGRAGALGPGQLRGAVIEVPDPDTVAERWARVLGVTHNGRELVLEGGEIRFAAGRAGLAELVVDEIPLHSESQTIGGVRFTASSSRAL